MMVGFKRKKGKQGNIFGKKMKVTQNKEVFCFLNEIGPFFYSHVKY